MNIALATTWYLTAVGCYLLMPRRPAQSAAPDALPADVIPPVTRKRQSAKSRRKAS